MRKIKATTTQPVWWHEAALGVGVSASQLPTLHGTKTPLKNQQNCIFGFKAIFRRVSSLALAGLYSAATLVKLNRLNPLYGPL
jgi:hypothetical protein